MARVPVRLSPGRLQPDLAMRFPWRCAENIAAGYRICATECCGACFFLDPASGCQLGGMRPVRCKTYPLIPQKDRVLLHGRCPDAWHFIESLRSGDSRAHALLDVAVAMSDLLEEGADDNSQEVAWMMEYVADGFRGPAVWWRGRGLVLPPAEDAPRQYPMVERVSAPARQGPPPRGRRKA